MAAVILARRSLGALAGRTPTIRSSLNTRRVCAPQTTAAAATLFSTMSESFLHGVELVNAQGDKSAGEDVVRGKVLALYFAADWCPDCRAFQPTLNEFYKEVNAEKQQLELVFVGSDSTQEDQAAHFKDKQGPWWAIPFESELRNELKRKYGVCAGKEQREVGVVERKGGIPSLVVVKPDGALVDLHGAENVEKDGASALGKWL